jgi:hypothetical protein
VICKLHRVIRGTVIGSAYMFWLASIYVCTLVEFLKSYVHEFFPSILLWICGEPSSPSSPVLLDLLVGVVCGCNPLLPHFEFISDF